MHDAIVKLKDGTKIIGPIWLWRPREGMFSVIDQTGVLEVRLLDVESAVQRGVRSRGASEAADEDLLARARRDGWDGA